MYSEGKMSVQLFHVGIKALVRNDEGKYLLLQVNPAKLSGNQPAYWDIPGGRIEEGDSVSETLAREVQEELGVDILGKASIAGEPVFFTAVVSNIKIPTENGEVGLVLMIYEVKVASQDFKISDEHIAFEWVDSATAAERLSHKYPIEFTSRFS